MPNFVVVIPEFGKIWGFDRVSTIKFQFMSATSLFRETLASIPLDVKKQVDWSFTISDKIATRLEELGMSQKELASTLGKSEAEVSRWLGGTHNFTLRTLAKISAALGEDLIHV